MTRRELAALALQSGLVADRMDDLCDILSHDGTVTLSRDEYREHAARYRLLVGVAREYHGAMCAGEVKHG